MSSKRRSMFVVAALLSGTVFLTACSSDDVEEFDAEAPLSSSSAPATAPTSAPAVAESSAASSDGSGKSSTGGGTSSDTTTPKKSASTPAKTEAAGDDATTGGGGGNTTIENINDGKGVSGTWFGNLKYLAPSKYTVSGLKGVEQQFFVANDTEIWGAGEICGDAEGQSATECTEAQLEAATQGVGFTAEVVVVNGIATKITEDHS